MHSIVVYLVWPCSYLYFDLLSYMFIVCSFIPAWVFVVLGYQLFSFGGVIGMDGEDQRIEFFWTVIPTFLVVVLCFLNLQFIGYNEWSPYTRIVKIVGNQWYWSYEDSNGIIGYSSSMSDLLDGVDKPLRLNYNSYYDLVVTSSDVIHSFSLPDFNLKMDGIPGRVNEAYFIPDRMGVFVGYCSELCGAGHAYMPIVVEVVSPVRSLV